MEACDKERLYESLQLAHKVILNSFYGYVMRRGARWHSMEMAAMVTHMGSSIISNAKDLIDHIGFPLELDTDGIWCMLPAGFPEGFSLKFSTGKTLHFDYPVSMLNCITYHRYLNPQYQTQQGDSLQYDIRREMSIFFEIDGPYKCMVIPASKEENKQLKKRYAVYHMNDKIAEIKGFEIKRRGELEILKIFQKNLFDQFPKGHNLQECYDICGAVAEKYLSILYSKGEGMDQKDVLDLITEQKMLSKTLEEYEGRKNVAITCAQRLGEQLGDEFSGKGLCCKFVISAYPDDLPVSQRSIPIQIFNAAPMERQKYLRKWTRLDKNQDLSLNGILDWKYYIDRLQSTVSKLLVIPSAMQKLRNPVASVAYPDWLIKRLSQKSNTQKMGLFLKNQNITLSKELPKQKQMQIEVKQKEEPIMEAKKEAQPVAVQKNRFSMEKEFSQWLQVEKKKWVLEQGIGDRVEQKGSHLEALLAAGEESLLSQTWHIIEVAETGEKGVFRVWVYLESGALTSVKVRVPRVLYVNSRKVQSEKSSQGVYRLSKKHLPRDKKTMFLYEFSLDEESFQSKQQYLDSFMSSPEVEGVYQSQIPLAFQFISQVGNTCKVKNQKSLSSLTISDLTPSFTYTKPYLTGPTLPQLFFGQACWNQKQLWLLVSPQKVMVTLLQNQSASSHQLAQTKAQLKELLRSKGMDQDILQLSQAETTRQAQDFFKSHLSSLRHFVLVLCSESACPLGAFLDFPVVRLQQSTFDSKLVSSLDWPLRLSSFLLDQQASSPQQYQELLQLARFGNIPLGNFPSGQKEIFAMDVFYSRVIRQDNCVSWYSTGGSPDLGAPHSPAEEYQALIGLHQRQESLQKPGLYVKYCLEIEIGLLALNTIAASEDLKNLDKDVSQLITQDDRDLADEVQQARNAFKYLRTIAVAWLQDALRRSNEQADLLVQNLHRWITSKESAFYDPLLAQMLQRLFQKLYVFLLNRLMQMGAHLIHADRNRIVLCTQKPTLQGAQVYGDFVLNTLLAHPLFVYLNLNVSRIWKVFFFRDPHNYFGILQNGTISLSLSLGHYLPPKIQGYFLKVLTRFIHQIGEYQQAKQMKLQNEMHVLELDDQEQDVRDFSRQFIRQDIANTLFSKIPDLLRIYRENKSEQESLKKELEQRQQIQRLQAEHTEDQLEHLQKQLAKCQEWEFPLRLGSITSYSDSVLELINFLAEVLGHDEHIKNEVISLKKNCLKYLGVSFYSKEAQFKEPSMSLRLYDLFCGHCHVVSDLDLFQEGLVGGQEVPCGYCQRPFDNSYLEHKLCKFIHDHLTFSQIQDLYCTKCSRAKSDLLPKSCVCSGHFATDAALSHNPFMEHYSEVLCNLRLIGEHLQLPLLQDLIQSLPFK